eukprot:COSAG01_NODE_33613_length_561_cov_1.346320_1_plen_23_part_10
MFLEVLTVSAHFVPLCAGAKNEA